MGRLTVRKIDRYGNKYIATGGGAYFEEESVYKALDKLAHYEDMEEQGRLIEVVRCKECWRYDTGAGYDGWGLCELYDQDRKDNDYCSFGELKELEGDKE